MEEDDEDWSGKEMIQQYITLQSPIIHFFLFHFFVDEDWGMEPQRIQSSRSL